LSLHPPSHDAASAAQASKVNPALIALPSLLLPQAPIPVGLRRMLSRNIIPEIRNRKEHLKMSNAISKTTLGLLAACAVALSLAACGPKSKQLKLAKPTKVRDLVVTTVHVAPDGDCTEQSDPAFKATAEYVAQSIVEGLEGRYGEAGLSAVYEPTPEDLPFLYQRRIFTSDGSDSWVTFFPTGNCPGMLKVEPNAPSGAAPFPEITFPDTWKIDHDAVLFVFVHSAALAGPPPTDLIEDMPEDYNYLSVVGYTLVATAGSEFLGAGHRVENSESIMSQITDLGIEVDTSKIAVEGLLIPDEKNMNQVLIQTLNSQINSIVEEIGTQLTGE